MTIICPKTNRVCENTGCSEWKSCLSYTPSVAIPLHKEETPAHQNEFHLESIKCPVCGKIQEAKVEHTIPFPTFIHDCIECEYTIMESEWDKVSTPAHQEETGAKEKARELVEKFLNDPFTSQITTAGAKQCALIHCDEIIAIFDNLISHYSDDFIPAKEHWQQVRNEISNL